MSTMAAARHVADRAVALRATGFAAFGLIAAIAVRAAMLRSRFLPEGFDGTAFAVLLVAVAAGTRAAMAALPAEPAAGQLHTSRPRAMAIGTLGGAVLVAVPVALRVLDPVRGPLSPAAGIDVGFGLWIGVTLAVAAAEEFLLRGALFDACTAAFGVRTTLVVTSVAFALMHVPFYGWGVIPLDFAVGLWLGGLRVATGGVLAPTVAHALADVAAWWL